MSKRHIVGRHIFWLIYSYNKVRPRGYKTFFMLNSTEHEISTSHKAKIQTNKEDSCFKSPRCCINHANNGKMSIIFIAIVLSIYYAYFSQCDWLRRYTVPLFLYTETTDFVLVKYLQLLLKVWIDNNILQFGRSPKINNDLTKTVEKEPLEFTQKQHHFNSIKPITYFSDWNSHYLLQVHIFSIYYNSTTTIVLTEKAHTKKLYQS